jgi:hypothetical protein
MGEGVPMSFSGSVHSHAVHLLCANKLSLNVEKSNFIIFHTVQKKIPFNPTIMIGNKQLKFASEIKYKIIYKIKNNFKENIIEQCLESYST